MKNLRIFISYARADQEFVAKLKAALLETKVLITEASDFSTQEDWTSSILSNIHKSDMLLAVVHRDRGNLAFELGYAMGAQKKVLLVTTSEEKPPSNFASLPCVSLARGFPSAISEVRKHLERLASRPSEPLRPLATFYDTLLTCVREPKYFESLDGSTFEKLLGEWFKAKGFTTYENRWLDYGCDFVAEWKQPRITCLVEAKKLSQQSLVSIEDVRTLAAAVEFAKATLGILISASGFTTSALALARSLNLRVLTIHDLLKIENEKELLTGAAPKPESPKRKRRTKSSKS